MAKTDWTLDDEVQPEDMNDIGEEINQLRTDLDNIDIPLASLTQAGIVQLSNATNSNAEDKAATPKAVKLAYDAAATAQTTANAANLAAAAAQTKADQAFQLGNERKQQVVDALIAKGVSASMADSWDTLISKMATIIKATGNAAPEDVLAGKTFSNATGNGLQGTMPNRGAGGTVTPGTTNQTKAAGYYSSPITVLGDADLVPSNIRSGVDLFGVIGSLHPLSVVRLQATSNPTSEQFQFAGNTSRISMFPLVVTGLAFKPRVIIAYSNIQNPGSHEFVFYTDFHDGFYPNTFKQSLYNAAEYGSTTLRNFKADVSPAQVTDTGFVMPVLNSNFVYEVLIIG